MISSISAVKPSSLRGKFMSAAVVILATLVLCVAQASAADPVFTSKNGITVQAQPKLNSRLVNLSITTTAVQGPQGVRVLLPEGYDQNSARRYPVLYLLHGGGSPSAPAGARDWTEAGGDAQAITAGQPLITVMPSAGNGGWYTNWYNPGAAAPQNWQTFHIEQLIPWIDANLKTIATKQGRAIAGLSMGGYGAMRYAARYPEKFAYAASFSGALNMLDPQQQRTIFYTEFADGKNTDGPFGVGSPLPLWFDGIWREADPVASPNFGVSHLRGVALALYTGAGTAPNDPNAQLPTNFEAAVNPTNHRMDSTLTTAGIPHYFRDYGRGTGFGVGCNGDHNYGCWNADLRDVLPRMMAVLQHP
ncbi:MAG: esterase family protein [Solirubrobacterales bacterium]|nr:esterase family protein [Solirubrobacterales bacterium]